MNSFARTPPILWQVGWSPEFSGIYKTLVPPPPGEYLQDRDVLKQYIYRINLLGNLLHYFYLFLTVLA